MVDWMGHQYCLFYGALSLQDFKYRRLRMLVGVMEDISQQKSCDQERNRQSKEEDSTIEGSRLIQQMKPFLYLCHLVPVCRKDQVKEICKQGMELRLT